MVSESKKLSRKVLDIERTLVWTRLVSALHDMLQAAGHTEWSPARLHGVLGNAFSFEMRKGGGNVWQEGNLDWWLFFQGQPEQELGCRIQRFQARQGDEQGDIGKIKAAAWQAVRASIDQGVPAAAWCPMSPEQNAARDWGLLVGYDEADETYTVRRRGGEFTAGYDAIGRAEPRELFCVLVYDTPESVDPTGAHVKALQNAVAFANGIRYDPKGAAFHVDARGLAAFELWREAMQSRAGATPEQRHPGSDGLLADSQEHSGVLGAEREYAAAYLRELVAVLPVAASELEKGAARYKRKETRSPALRRRSLL